MSMAQDATAAERQRRHRAQLARIPRGDVVGLNTLVAAVIGELPQAGEEFPRDERQSWLKMMAIALDVAYGRVEPIAFEEARQAASAPPALALVPAAVGPVRQAHAGHGFYISIDGTACNADGTPVLISDVPPDEMVFDYRPVTGEFRDTASIVWADGQRGTAGLSPGVSFCGPG